MGAGPRTGGNRPGEIFGNGEIEREVARRCLAILLVLNDTRRLPMAEILRSPTGVVGDRRLPSARRALMRWSYPPSAHTSAQDLDGVIVLGFNPDDGPEVHGHSQPWRLLIISLSNPAPGLLGGLCNLPTESARDDDAVDDIIRSRMGAHPHLPASRPGSVSANVLLDVRKRYRRKAGQGPASDRLWRTEAPSAEEQFVSHAFIEELVTAVPFVRDLR